MYIVTYTDYGDNCDMHTRQLAARETREEAEAEVAKDMENYVKNFAGGGELIVNENEREIWVDGEIGVHGCVWDIHEVKNAIPTSVF